MHFRRGKSTTFALIARQVKGKCLILDPGGAPAYAEFPEMAAENAYKFVNPSSQGKIWRIQDTGDRIHEISCVFGFHPPTQRISKQYAYLNGNLFLEDAGAYLDSNLKRAIKANIKAMKQHGLNLYLSYHSIDEISTDVLCMSPSILILKKTGDVHVFSGITKAKKLSNYNKVLEAFYRAKFKGLDANAIFDLLPYEDLFAVAQDLRIVPKSLGINGNPRKELLKKEDCLKRTRHLAKWANGKIRLSAKEKKTGEYHTEVITLR